jgi:hypothetical protein
MKKKHTELREIKPDYDIFLLILVFFFPLMIKNPNLLFIKFFFFSKSQRYLVFNYSLFFVMNSKSQRFYLVEFKQSIIKSLGGQIEFYPKLKATIFESHTCEGTHMPLT